MRLLCLALLVAAPLAASAQGFIENRGQWDAEVLFLAQTPGYAVWITRDGFVADLRATETPRNPTIGTRVHRHGHVVRVRAGGDRLGAVAEALDKQPGRRHYFLGATPVTDVRTYGRVRVPTRDGAIRYTVTPRGLRATVEGGTALRTEGARLGAIVDGIVLLEGSMPLAEIVFETTDGLREADVVGTALVPGRPWTEPGVQGLISGDGPILWSTFLGDTGSDFADEIAVDAEGRVVIAGFTSSVDFPTTPGAYDETYNLQSDAFVARFTPDGSALDYATVLGGNRTDIGYGVATNAAGQVVVVGETISADFPRTAGVAASTESTAFAARFSPDGAALEYAILLGGGEQDQALAAILAGDGTAIIAGTTLSSDFPVTPGAYDPNYSGAGDAFIVGLNDRDIQFSTFLGGFDTETADALSFTTDRRVVIVGTTRSVDFPVRPDVFQGTLGGGIDGYVAWLSTDGTALDQATFLGGAATEVVWSVASDGSGNVVVGGETFSADFPTTPGAVDTTYNDAGDGFVARLSADATAMEFGAFLGGADVDVVHGVAFDDENRIVAAGATRSADFPAPMGTFSGFDDAFVIRIAPEAFYFDGGTFLGASDVDEARDLAIAPDGRILVAGATRSANFPTTPDAFDRTHGGSSDVFVTALSLPVLVSAEVDALSTVTISAPVPNPARGSARLGLVLEAPAHVGLTVFDALGRRVATAPGASQPSGRHDLEIPLTGLTPGVYTVRVAWRTSSGEEQVAVRRLVVAR